MRRKGGGENWRIGGGLAEQASFEHNGRSRIGYATGSWLLLGVSILRDSFWVCIL
jgi:hypothetical protein